METVILVHDTKNVTGIIKNGVPLAVAHPSKIVASLLQIALEYPKALVVWVHNEVVGELNTEALPQIFRHEKVMASFNPDSNFLPDAIGYVEDSFFIDVKKQRPFPTWQMSGLAGGIEARTLTAVASGLPTDDDFDYFLTSVAKLAMPEGLFCYSDPRLLKRVVSVKVPQADFYELFRFVSEHYKKSWVLLLLLNSIAYDKKWPLLAAFLSLFRSKRQFDKKAFNAIRPNASAALSQARTMDVLIPTFGRKPYLYDFLKDLSTQTELPQKVIIVEQNPIPDSVSELDYLESETWPFEIKHIFLHRAGACNARNLALKEVTSDWIFFADDDIRIPPDFIASVYDEMYRNGMEVYNICCITQNRPQVLETVHQTSIFGGSCSIVTKKSADGIMFNPALEFGFGEDGDFGNQLIRKGYDICYLPNPIIEHLKAPSGGFRIKMPLPWENDDIAPKPAPTVFLFRLLNNSTQQLLGYRTVLFFKFYKFQRIKNPFRYRKVFAKMWDRSEYWARRINDEKNGRALD